MKNKMNREILEGRLYDFDLAKKTVKNQASNYYGQEFWSGTIHIATDEAGLNVIPVHYTFVLPTFGNGKTDSRFSAFEKITTENKAWVREGVGKENAEKIRLTPSGDLNDFYMVNDDRAVSAQRNEGGFITFIKELAPEGTSRNKFTYDMIINKVTVVEPKEGTDDVLHARIHGVIFNFREAILPWDLIAYNPKAIEYFEGLGVSSANPIYTQVWGSIKNTTIRVEKEVENAWGEPMVEYSERTRREWVIEGSKPQLYDFTDEDRADLQKKVADRNIHLEEVKSAAIAYANSQKNAIQSPPTPNTMAGPLSNIPMGDFNDF